MLLRQAVLCLLLSAAAFAASAEGVESGLDRLAMITPSGATKFATMPSDEDLAARGARIGRIEVVVDDVFENSLSLAAPYRLVNSLHISTRQATVNSHLLFRQGERFNRRLLDETARILRDQRYFYDASVEPLRYNDDNTVDVRVRVHDVWTMSPGISFGRKGGENNLRFEFEDTNFLGFGKTVSVQRSSDVDRSAWRLGYVDPHVFGSWWKLSAAHTTLSDGSDEEFSFGRPFYSLDSRWSAQVSAIDSDLTMPRYALGKEIERIGTQTQVFGLDGGLSRGLENGWARRYLFGLKYDAKSFSPTLDAPDAFIPEDRRYFYPYVGMQWLEDSYITTRNFNQIGRTEDLHLGRSFAVTAGFASSALGSTSDALMLSASGEAGFDLGAEQYFIGGLGLTSRVEGSGLQNAQLDASGGYYKRQSAHRVLYLGLSASYTSHLDEDTQLLLGGDNGLRGYPLRYQAGTSRAVLTAEERFYTNWQPFKLVDVGAAIFADTGRMWGQDRFAPAPAGWLSDVGFGLRLGNARSGLGSILHIDVAFPLNRASDIDSVQFLIETKKSF